MDRFTTKQKKELKRIIVALVMFIILLIVEHSGIVPEEGTGKWVLMALYLVPYFIVGWDVVKKCFIGIKNKQLFDESFLMTLATVGAFGCGEFAEACAVMLFYQIGEFFQDYAVNKSRGSIAELMDMAPEYANRETKDGEIEVIDPDDIQVGDTLVIKAGEKVPTDGTVIEGSGFVNTSALTGESMPTQVSEGDQVISGSINGDTLLKIRAEKEYDDCTVSQILELVEDASSRKSETENFITRFARVYTPAVVIAAVILAFIPPLISGNFTGEFGKWVLRACTFLVISCPCALVISVPLAFFGGIGAASRKGVLVKGSNYLELLSNLHAVVSDKTGTLTVGSFKVTMIDAAESYTTEDVVRYAAAVEEGSTHPIAKAIVEACDNPISSSRVKDEVTVAGKGVKATVGKSEVIVGNKSYLEDEGVNVEEKSSTDGSTSYDAGTMVYVAKDGEYIGTIVVSDAPKEGAKEAIAEMFKQGVKRFVMLTGDSESVAASVAEELGISEYRAELLPQDKVSSVEEFLQDLGATEDETSKEARKRGSLAFIGDGINDAPVLSRADVGIAMGSLGSDAAIEAADVVIMDDDLAKIPSVMGIARKTLGISRQNIIFALFIKFGFLVLGALGIANMWIAVFADVGVAILCILNSMRMLVKK